MIGFLGLSHLGLVSAAAAAKKGFDVIGFDADAALIDRIGRGDLPVAEPNLPELVAEVAAKLELTANPVALARCPLLYISLDVPTAADDTSDPLPVARLVELAAAQAARGSCVVVLSQVEPGFTRSCRAIVERGGRSLCYQVETLIFGRAVDRALNPERFVVGCANPNGPLPAALSEHLAAYGCPILKMRYESAELCKIAINALLVSTISATNTLAELSEVVGADWSEIAPALRLDRRIGPHAYVQAGLGIGGSNLSRDLETIERIAASTGADAGVVRAWRSHARHRAGWPLRVLHERVLSRVERPRIALWGLSYKEHTESTRNSPGLRLAQTLAAAGVETAAYDPEAEPVTVRSPAFRRVDAPLEACTGADALVIATAWPAFAAEDPAAVAAELRGHVVVDPYTILDAEGCRAAGLAHVRLGAPAC